MGRDVAGTTNVGRRAGDLGEEGGGGEELIFVSLARCKEYSGFIFSVQTKVTSILWSCLGQLPSCSHWN
jgi:hypothetical protein